MNASTARLSAAVSATAGTPVGVPRVDSPASMALPAHGTYKPSRDAGAALLRLLITIRNRQDTADQIAEAA